MGFTSQLKPAHASARSASAGWYPRSLNQKGAAISSRFSMPPWSNPWEESVRERVSARASERVIA